RRAPTGRYPRHRRRSVAGACERRDLRSTLDHVRPIGAISPRFPHFIGASSSHPLERVTAMWHRRHQGETTMDRTGSDPVAAVIWQEGHLTGEATSMPVIKAPRAGDLSATDAA